MASQDCEVNLPGLMGFLQYCIYNLSETAKLYGGKWVERNLSGWLLGLLAGPEKAMAEALREGKLGVMDYYQMKNVIADTNMRDGIANAAKPQPAASTGAEKA